MKFNLKTIAVLFASATIFISCGGDDSYSGAGTGAGAGSGNNSGSNNQSFTKYNQIPEIAQLGIKPDNEGGIIMDFSRVGYQWGDKEIPSISVVKTISAPTNGEDATKLIQNAIDEVSALPRSKRGAILLKAGKYNVSGGLTVSASGIVLRGEGSDPTTGTHIHSTRTDDGYAKKSQLITIGTKGSRKFTKPSTANIVEDVPVGQFWVRVSNPYHFSVNQNVVVYMYPSMELVKDLKMDQIGEGFNWNESTINSKYMERIITKKSGDTIWFENPISISLLKKYGGGAVSPYYYDTRIEECGVEDMFLDCVYNKSKGELDEMHCWNAIFVNIAQHCWVTNVHAKHFCYSCVQTSQYAKNITVSNCKMSEHISTVGGERRYSFCIVGQLCLYKDCEASSGRHSYVTNGKATTGPNVFLRGKATDTRSDIGPHQRFANGTLYDNIVADGLICIQDRWDYGTGHGWAGVNEVLWNCKGNKVTVQSPWVLGNNYSIGTIGTKHAGRMSGRPDGVWVSHGTHVSPTSLYEAQLAARRVAQPGGVFDVK